MSAKLKVCGVVGRHVPKSENRENASFSAFPKVKIRSYKSKKKQNNSTELLGHSFLTTYNKHAHPQTPHPDVARSFYRTTICKNASQEGYNSTTKVKHFASNHYCFVSFASSDL